jgi:ectoine hydroxylase-related dioxygenase (phytanoyl-CoA dioxygenase family)
VVMQAGQVSFHHPLTFHGSGPNTSQRLRRSLAVHLVDADVRAVDLPGIWQHYNLGLFRERGGLVGETYRFDDLCPAVGRDGP